MDRESNVAADGIQLVLCPCPDRQEAARIGRVLVDEKLAAAVNIIEQDSIFRWQGQIRETKEYLLLIKSPRRHYEQIERRILEIHSYNLPGIAAVPIADGLGPYLEWIGHGGSS